jgi:hypothetical protein
MLHRSNDEAVGVDKYLHHFILAVVLIVNICLAKQILVISNAFLFDFLIQKRGIQRDKGGVDLDWCGERADTHRVLLDKEMIHRELTLEEMATDVNLKTRGR